MPTGRVLYFTFPSRTDIWKPQAPTLRDLQGESWNEVILLRLRPGEFAERGRQQLQTLLNPPGALRPGRPEEIPTLVPIRDIYAGTVRLRLLLLLAASALLLLLACTNIANLLVAHVMGRSSEFAMRMALGASRPRVTGQVLRESTLLALMGRSVALAISYVSVRLLVANRPAELGLVSQAHVNLPVLLFTTLASFVTGLVCGVMPAWHASHKDPAFRLRGSDGSARRRPHSALPTNSSRR